MSTAGPPAIRFMQATPKHVVCTLCAHNCHIAPGKTGVCQVRANRAGAPSLPFYGQASALQVDPVEKKPLYHFNPGARLLSIGFLGCNFRCPFCQNFSISQDTRARSETVTPRELVGLTEQSGALGVAYTYNEPTIHFEYVLAASQELRGAGLANVLVTNGHLTRKPARELLSVIDAANVDLKSFSETFYRDELGGSLKAVLDFISIAAELTWVEVTTLLIPGRNDADEEVDSIARFIASLSPDIPLHLSGYYPTYQYDVAATTPRSIERAVEIARRHLRHVYPGNVSDSVDTRCSSCGETIVRRRGLRSSVTGERAGSCATCGAPSPLHWFSRTRSTEA